METQTRGRGGMTLAAAQRADCTDAPIAESAPPTCTATADTALSTPQPPGTSICGMPERAVPCCRSESHPPTQLGPTGRRDPVGRQRHRGGSSVDSTECTGRRWRRQGAPERRRHRCAVRPRAPGHLHGPEHRRCLGQLPRLGLHLAGVAPDPRSRGAGGVDLVRGRCPAPSSPTQGTTSRSTRLIASIVDDRDGSGTLFRQAAPPRHRLPTMRPQPPGRPLVGHHLGGPCWPLPVAL